MKKFILSVLVIVIVAVVSAVIWLSALDGNYNVKRSITVNKSNGDVFNLVQDFNKWAMWSPWLCMEPDAVVGITGSGMTVNDTYSWKGELVGEGTITHMNIEPQKMIEQDIVFKMPMESKSFVYWEFSDVNDSTTIVTWGMKGEMPFILRFMTKMMEPMIGMDYERGLKMIKELAEKGYVASRVEIVGVVDASEMPYLGEKVACTMDEVSETMHATFSNLKDYAQKESLNYDKAASIYHKFDFLKEDCEYTAALLLSDTLSVSAPYYSNVIPAVKALKIRFVGDYEHLGNAWAAGMSYIQMHKLKENKEVAPYEVYINNPKEESDPRKWITEVYMPIK